VETNAGIIEPSAVDQRPLWRKVWEFPLVALLVALALVAGALALIQFGLSLIDPAGINPDLRVVISVSLAVGLVFVVCKVVISRLGRHPRDDLPLAQAPAHLALGLAIGFGLFSGVVAVAALLGVYRISGWGTLEGGLAFFMFGGVFAGFVEEVLFRGIIFRWLEELAGSWIALLLSAALFGAAHAANDNATVFSSAAIAIEAGVLLGAAYMITRSLWLAIGLHAGWNLTQGLVFDVNVSGNAVDGLVEAQLTGPELLSGGAFGLEASVIAVVIATSAGLWGLAVARRRGEIVAPMWSKRRTLPGALSEREPGGAAVPPPARVPAN
jgi:membrane protease YdiL (CAAX protease family)